MEILQVMQDVFASGLTILFLGHGSVGFEYEGHVVYVDPVADFHDYADAPKADLVLVTHEHGDHLDAATIEALAPKKILMSAPVREALGRGGADVSGEALGRGEVLPHGETRDLGFVTIQAVPAYNTSPEQLNFHPRDRAHNGYILTFGGVRVYVAGDTEPTPEMLALKDIDIAFLPVNQPYTMTERQAADAVRAIRPRIFYPYHFGGTDRATDLDKLVELLDGSGVEVRLRPME